MVQLHHTKILVLLTSFISILPSIYAVPAPFGGAAKTTSTTSTTSTTAKVSSVITPTSKSSAQAATTSSVGNLVAPSPTPSLGQRALIISKAGDETPVISTLGSYGTPYDIVFVDGNGFTSALPTLTAGTYQMIVMTGTFIFPKTDATGETLWLPSINETSLKPITTYLSNFNARLVKLNDAPDANLGTVPATGAGYDNGQNVIFADATATSKFAKDANLQPGIALSTAGLYHVPASITNTTLASPVLLFDILPPTLTTTTIAAALIQNPTGGLNYFQQLSFYLPFASWSVTSQNLNQVWYSWGMSKSLAPVDTPVTVGQKVLVLTKPTEANTSTIILQAYGIPFDVVEVPMAGLAGNLTLQSNANTGIYNLIVMTSALTYGYNINGQTVYNSALTAAQYAFIYAYQTTFNARLVVLGDFPSPNSGVVALSGTSDNHNVIFSDFNFAVNAGLQPSMAIGTTGLYHYPCNITNPTIAKPVLLFDTLAPNWPSQTVAAAVITQGTRQQLSFYLPFAWWSTSSMVLSHIWVQWGTRGLYQGYRRISWSAHVDDLFLTSTVAGDGGMVGQSQSLAQLHAGTGVDFRINKNDMNGIQAWQADYNKRMNPGSDFRLDLCFNGNGILEASNLKNPALPAPLDHADTDVPINFIKPLGSGYTYWPSTAAALAPFQLASFQTNFAAMKANDDLFDYFVSNGKNFYLNHHTFSHENLNNCTYSDAFHELQSNYWMAVTAGWVGQSFWSNHSMVTPSISGLFNGDALKALWDFGIRSIQGDDSRTNTVNNTNFYWPMISTKATSNFDGFNFIARSATRVYYNCSTTQEDAFLHNALYPGQGATFPSILQQEVDRVIYKLFALHQDAYMFHQANLRNADITGTNGTVLADTAPLRNLPNYPGGGTKAYTGGNGGALGLLQAWVEVITAAYNQYTTWPMITYKVDDMETRALARVSRETAGVVVQIVGATRGSGYTQVVVTSAKPCVAAVTFPKPVSGAKDFVNPSAAWSYEMIGSDPVTVWVPLQANTPVTMTLASPLPFA
ncbi:hypothetical protein HDU76_007252 [Blyttiomyces sp. JEL0837]|nr:hypothetical protein HDU76_007252 [Blyttiomyces sp. JEL0837]